MVFQKYIATGQGALTLCCLFYAVWWYVAYNPKITESTFSGMSGILFWITFAFGIAGLYLNICGIRNLWQFCLIGGAVYIVLLAITVLIFKRPVTAELFLIVVWATLETAVIFSVYHEDILSGIFPTISLIIIVIATIFSIIAYLLYYLIDEWKAFYLGLLPLILYAISSAFISFIIIHRFKL